MSTQKIEIEQPLTMEMIREQLQHEEIKLDDAESIYNMIEKAKMLLWKDHLAHNELLTEKPISKYRPKLKLKQDPPPIQYPRRYYDYYYVSDITIAKYKIELLQTALHNDSSQLREQRNAINLQSTHIKRLCRNIHGCNNRVNERRDLKEIQHAQENPISESKIEYDMETCRKKDCRTHWRYSLKTITEGSRKTLKDRLKNAFKELQFGMTEEHKVHARKGKLRKEEEKASSRHYNTLLQKELNKIDQRKVELDAYIFLLGKQIEKGTDYEGGVCNRVFCE